MARIKIGVSDYTDGQFLVKGASIINCLTNNAHFANPIPPLSEVKTALDAFDAALSNMMPGNREATLIKNKCRATLEQLLKELGLFVQLASKGDPIILSTSGYDLASTPQPIGVLPKPENFLVKPGEARGSIKVSVKSILGAKSYMYEYTKAPLSNDSVWSPIASPRVTAVIDGLESGQQYTFRAVGIGSNNTRVYSDDISSYVL